MDRVKRWTLIATIMGSSIAFIDGSVVSVALPAIQRDLGGGLAAQQWWVTAYLLTLGSLILVGGSLGDIFGEMRMFTLGVAAFGVASVLCAIAPDATSLIVFRGIQGVAGALLTPASLAVITSTFSGTERGAAIGAWTAWSGVSFVIGPLLGGWLIDVSSWRLIPGALAGGALMLAAFVVYEMHTAMPMLPLRLFGMRNFSVTNVETFAVYGALSGWGVFMTLFLQEFSHYSPFRAGLASLPVTIVMFFLSPRVGRLSMRYGPRLFMAAGPVIAGGSLLALARMPVHLDYWIDLLPPLLGFSVGLSMTVAPLTTTVLSDAGPGDAGIASGVNNAVARVAGLVAVAVLGIAAAGGGDHLTVGGFHQTMVVVAALLVTGGLIGAGGLRNNPA